MAFLNSRFFKLLSGACLVAGLYVLCEAYPRQASKFAALAALVAGALPSALAGAQPKDEDPS